MEHQTKKIVIIGPESTGKSTLCTALAAHYNCEWVAEYARQYLLEHGTDYSFDDLMTIAKGQLALEDAALARNTNKPLLLIDTDMYVMKVWGEFVFNDCHKFILDKIVERKYDLYLLCNTDLTWTKDELREYPDLDSRLRLFHHYKDLLEEQNVPWALVNGMAEDRVRCAIKAIDEILR